MDAPEEFLFYSVDRLLFEEEVFKTHNLQFVGKDSDK